MSRPNPSCTWLRSHCYLQMYYLHNSIIRMYVRICAHVLHFIQLMWHFFAHCSLQLSISSWSSKRDTVQMSSPSFVDTVLFPLTQAELILGQWREVTPLALPFLVQCTQSGVTKSTVQQSVEWPMSNLLFSVLTMYLDDNLFILNRGHSWIDITTVTSDMATERLHTRLPI